MRLPMRTTRSLSHVTSLAAAVLFLVLGAAGCAKSSGSYSAAGGAPGGVDAYYEGDASVAPSSDGAEYREEAYADGGAKMDARYLEAPPAPAPSSGPVVQPTEPEPKPPADGEPPKNHGRQIIYTADMQVSVFNVEDTMKKAEALPETFGGWIQARSEGYVQMKIPARRLREAMEEITKWGRVDRKSLQASDVTAEYVDLDSRIRVLRSTQAQLLELLTKAKTVEETLNVRRALDQVTMELEVALGRMRQLESQIAFSTLSLNLVEQGPHLPNPSSNDPFPWVDMLGVEATEYN